MIAFFFSFYAFAQLDTVLIKSQILEEDIEVYLYGMERKVEKTIYLTDGEKWLQYGGLTQIQILEKEGKIPLYSYVFISTTDPKTGIDKRNNYFFCNADYVSFFEKELIPNVEKVHRKHSLVGLSFGGLNAAYFSAHSSLFEEYVLLSPITYPCSDVIQDILFSDKESLSIFLSTGQLDAEKYVQALKSIYESKGYQMEFLQTKGGHDFENWLGQMERFLK
jgi:enterochelin esterase-like enzyme